jgi:hypothetical protein
VKEALLTSQYPFLTFPFTASLRNFQDQQQEDDPFSLESIELSGKCRFAFKAKTALCGMLEFDILPALRALGELKKKPHSCLLLLLIYSPSFSSVFFVFIAYPFFIALGGSYLLLDGETGVLIPSSNELAIRKMERLSNTFKGLREMIKILKLISKGDPRLSNKGKGLPLLSCAFETVVMVVAESVGPNKVGQSPVLFSFNIILVSSRLLSLHSLVFFVSSSQWDTSSFVTIFRSCLLRIKEGLENPGVMLPPPNDPTEDLLSELRNGRGRERKELEDFIDRWLEVESSHLLEKLQKCCFRHL